MKLRESRHGRTTVFHLEGEIDTHYAPALRSLLEAKKNARCTALVLDLSAVRFIDSTGIAVVIEYLRDCAAFDGQFCIAGATSAVRHVLDVVQLEKALPIFESVEEAITATRDGCVPVPDEPLFGSLHHERSSAAA